MGNRNLRIFNLEKHRTRRGNGEALSHLGQRSAGHGSVLKQDAFHAMLTRERRRAERSRKPFVLLLLDAHAIPKKGNGTAFIERLTSIVSATTRETDIIGWHEEGDTLAVIFTEISLEGKSSICEVLHSKVVSALRENLDPKVASDLIITVHLFPESWDENRPDRVGDIKLYPDLSGRVAKRQPLMAIKRVIDIAGSGILLLLLLPVLAVIALAIKLYSEGPVIFEQERLGQFGKSFKCLKFRTMYANNDPRLHRDFVRRLIAGKAENADETDSEPAVYKITNDPRVTPVGKFLRKSSLDEVPQLWNVLRGEMSLVGPRPPVPYEFDVYDFWHRRRVLEVKPGVTGLWQVSGRSRTCFDDMVRLDLRYTQSWSLWLDLKILLATPRAVFIGDGAF
jgi:lipopolysaccharide/colanic/teichoic acid biosynthesis glycosyltransferase/GGDEF domain-containing protein